MSQAHASERLTRPWLQTAWLRYLDAPAEHAADRRTVAGALAVGVVFDVAMRAGVNGAAGALCVGAAAALLVATGRLRNPHAVLLVAAAPLFGVWLLFRTSDWLIPLDVIAAAGLIGFGASLASGGSGLSMTIPELAARIARGTLQALLAPGYLFRGAFGSGKASRLGAVARGLLIVAPLVIVLGALLTSADAVFASFFSFDTSNVALHVSLVGFGTLAMGALVRLASTAQAAVPDVEGPRLGAVESYVVLTALNVLLGAFAAARLVALSEGGRRVLSSAGLTYAEYARSGFFQLLFAAVIVVAALLALRATADVPSAPQQRVFTGLSLGVVALTLAVCVSAFQRLVLYESVFGLTMLRLYVQTAIVWVAGVVVMLGVLVCLRRVRRAWLAPAAAILALVLLFALNVLNPEAFVARHNVSHPATRFDASYLTGLSDDAAGVITSRAKGTDDVARALRLSICTTGADPLADDGGWASYNVARDRARGSRSELC